MKKVVLWILPAVPLLLATPSSLFAADPPVIPGTPPTWVRTGVEESDVTPALFNGPSRYPQLSPWLSGPFVAWANHRHNASTMVESNSPADVVYRSSAGRNIFAHALNVPSSIIPAYHTDVSNVAGNEGEPSLIAFTNSNGTFTAQSYQQGDATHQFQITVASTTDPQSGPFTKTTPYIPTNYTDAFDTMLTTNPYTDGVRPGAMYLTSLLAYSTAAGQPIGNPMTVRVWGSDDGGSTWTTSGQTVDYTASTSAYTLDKPVADVSKYPATRGSLYVAWVQVPATTSDPSWPKGWRILVRRNTNGLWQLCRPVGGGCDTSWDNAITVNDGHLQDQASGPQVVVNPDNGNVYVFWLTASGEIQMRRSVDGGVTYQPAVTAAPITVVSGIRLVTSNYGYLPNGLRANLLPMIRYNVAAHTMMATWHARMVDPEPLNGTNETGIYFATFNPDTITSPVTATLVNDAAGSQIQPAIDADPSGNVLITYYTTENYTTTNRYELYAIALSSTGVRLAGPTPINSGPAGSGGYANTFLGDYHDNFYFTYPAPSPLGGLWTTSWTSNSGTSASPATDTWFTGAR